MAEQLWLEIEELEDDVTREAHTQIEYREQFFQLILRLFEKDFHFAMEKGAHKLLWKSQRVLFGKVRAHYDSVNARLNAKAAPKSKNRRDKVNAEIAKVNYKNVLRTVLCEWSKVAMIVEEYVNANLEKIGDDAEDIEQLELLPLSRSCLKVVLKFFFTSNREDAALTQFATFLHLRFGDVMRYLNDVDNINTKLQQPELKPKNSQLHNNNLSLVDYMEKIQKEEEADELNAKTLRLCSIIQHNNVTTGNGADVPKFFLPLRPTNNRQKTYLLSDELEEEDEEDDFVFSSSSSDANDSSLADLKDCRVKTDSQESLEKKLERLTLINQELYRFAAENLFKEIDQNWIDS